MTRKRPRPRRSSAPQRSSPAQAGPPAEEPWERFGVTACTFTHGDERTRKGPCEVLLGKAYLVSRLQALLHAQSLHLPQTPEAAALVEELLDYEIRVDRNGHDRYGAFRVGTHDDLVTALGLAVQVDHAASL